ncbi:DUF2933 domain-containing protein [Candidatus Micrarchaeota archaeon]|nr:DUF2933 domain-containing protein [Candidatus Micrarchaeota archaeon]
MDLSWKSLKNNHVLLMALCCLIPLILVFGIAAFGPNLRNFSWIILLVCPLLMMFMMKDMHSGHEGHTENAKSETIAKSGLSMKKEPPAKKGASCH